MMRITIASYGAIIYFPIMVYRDSCPAEGQWDGCLSAPRPDVRPRFMFKRCAQFSSNNPTLPPRSSRLKGLLTGVHDGNDRMSDPHLGAELAGLDLGFLFESVVSVVVSKGVLDEGREHKHVTDPEVDI